MDFDNSNSKSYLGIIVKEFIDKYVEKNETISKFIDNHKQEYISSCDNTSHGELCAVIKPLIANDVDIMYELIKSNANNKGIIIAPFNKYNMFDPSTYNQKTPQMSMSDIESSLRQGLRAMGHNMDYDTLAKHANDILNKNDITNMDINEDFLNIFKMDDIY